MIKIYYRLKMIQKSPLRIGKSDSEMSDNDIMLDGRDKPFIPGTSLAGVLRDNVFTTYGSDVADRLFGSIGDAGSGNETKLIISDGVLDKGDDGFVVSVRDGVGLDEWGTAIKGPKYDFQVVETKSPYYAVIEWTGNRDEIEKDIDSVVRPMLSGIVKNGLQLGARTTRGYGQLEVSVSELTFDYDGKDALSEWLDFNPFAPKAFDRATGIEGCDNEKSDLVIDMDLKLLGSFTVKVNTSRTEVLEDGSVPDSVPLMSSLGEAGMVPVIPGTSWAGSFRHHMERIVRELGMNDASSDRTPVDDLFGFSDKRERSRSCIRFSETCISGGNSVTIMRNAVDRFTCAPKNTGLFTNQVWQGGKGRLRITIDGAAAGKQVRRLLSAVLNDLNNGILTIGGEAGIGRGRAGIERIVVNDIDVTSKLNDSAECMKILED